MFIGCARISTNEQDTITQSSAPKAADCERISEQATQAVASSELQPPLDYPRNGQVLVVRKLS